MGSTTSSSCGLTIDEDELTSNEARNYGIGIIKIEDLQLRKNIHINEAIIIMHRVITRLKYWKKLKNIDESGGSINPSDPIIESIRKDKELIEIGLLVGPIFGTAISHMIYISKYGWDNYYSRQKPHKIT
jgi:hypothetical protein